jgi:hypothetical protein
MVEVISQSPFPFGTATVRVSFSPSRKSSPLGASPFWRMFWFLA